MININYTPQFKTNTVFQSYRFKVAKENRSIVAMLARLFQYGTKAYPSKRELKQKLEALYNVQFATGVEREGDILVLTFTTSFPEYRFVNDTTAFLEVIGLFTELVQHPYFMESVDFNAEFEQERYLLINQIKSIYDDKTQYAFTKLQTQLLESTPFFEDITGSVEMVEHVTLDEVRACWLEIQKSAQIEAYCTVAKEETAIVLQEALLTNDVIIEKMTHTANLFPINENEEIQKVMQAKINFALTSGVRYDSADYFASLIATSILGGGSHSKLFQNVREKQSLAYYANAITDSESGIVYIYSGVNVDKVEQARACIFEQIDAMKKGDISLDDIILTKKDLVNNIRESLNRPMGIIQFQRKLKKHPGIVDLESYIAQIDLVTKEDVVAVANKWTYNGQFILKGEA